MLQHALCIQPRDVTEHLDRADPASGQARGVVFEQVFYLTLLLRGELASLSREELDTVVRVRVVRGADDAAGGGPEKRREGCDAWRRQDTEVNYRRSAARETGGEGTREHIPGETGIAPDKNLPSEDA